MRNRTAILITAIAVLAVLAISGTAAAMTWNQTNFTGNGYGYPGMMNGQPGYGYPGMMNGQPGYGYPGMMNGQQHNRGMMGGYQQGTPVTGGTHVTIQNSAYQPANMQVRVGTMVTWTNQDNVPHSVTLKNGMMDSGMFPQGKSFSYTFTTPGTYQYYCTVHPYMVATVTVLA